MRFLIRQNGAIISLLKFNVFIQGMLENKTLHVGVRGLGPLTLGIFKQLIKAFKL